MSRMNTITIAIIAIITYIIVIPVLEQIATVLCTWLEVLKGIATLLITKINVAIENMQEPEHYSQAIGFEIPQDEYYEEDEFEEEDKKNKIGF